MEYLTLRNGLKFPKIGIGTYQVKGKECYDSVLWALEEGYRLIDTAEMYENEGEVGKAISDSLIPRKELTIVTKVNYKSYNNAEKIVENSLKLLGCDYLDAVLLHWPYNDYYTAWRTLEKLYEKGIIKSIGVSNFEPDRLVDISLYNNVVPFINEIETNLYCQRKYEREWMNRYNVSHIAYTPLGQGKKNEIFELSDVKRLSRKYGKTPAQIMLRFLTQQDICVIPKSVHKERIKENFDIFDFTLDNDDMNALKALDTGIPLVGNPTSPIRTEKMAKAYLQSINK